MDKLLGLEKQNLQPYDCSQKNLYTDKLNEILHKYNNTYHRTINLKPIDLNPSMYIYFDVKNSDINFKFKIGDPMRPQKQIFFKRYTPN